jgi:hypothetical protein
VRGFLAFQLTGSEFALGSAGRGRRADADRPPIGGVLPTASIAAA